MAAVNISLSALLNIDNNSMSPADRAAANGSFRPVIILDGRIINGAPSSTDIGGGITLEGLPFGIGDVQGGSPFATVSLEQGTSHRVEFSVPESSLFYYDGPVPTSLEFTIPPNSTGETYSVTYTARKKQETARLTVNTNYQPALPVGVHPAEIRVIGGQPLQSQVVRLRNDRTGNTTGQLVLSPGEYTILFEDVQTPESYYRKPAPFVVRLQPGSTVVESRVYNGFTLPTIYWLKPVFDSNQKQVNSQISVGLFSDNITNLTTFFTSSISTTIDQYHTQIYHKSPEDKTSEIQFSVAYGHVEGSGSANDGGEVRDTPTRAIYGQYRNIIMGTNTGRFNLTGQETDSIYVLTYQRERKTNKLDYNAFELNLAHLSGSEFISGDGYMAAHTGSNVTLGGQNKVLRLITDYKLNPSGSLGNAGYEYNIVSGSIERGVFNPTSPKYYGKLYTSLGTVLLDGVKLDMSASFGTVTSREVDGMNQLKLFTAISGAADFTDGTGDFLGMKARGIQEEMVHYYFLDLKNREFNYSNNPTFNSSGEIVGDSYETRPKVYATTIGLYDENRNLLAVAKTSQPEKKSPTDEVMYTLKLKL